MQFVDHDFASLSGARVVRIATHPDFQKVRLDLCFVHLSKDALQCSPHVIVKHQHSPPLTHMCTLKCAFAYILNPMRSYGT